MGLYRNNEEARGILGGKGEWMNYVPLEAMQFWEGCETHFNRHKKIDKGSTILKSGFVNRRGDAIGTMMPYAVWHSELPE